MELVILTFGFLIGIPSICFLIYLLCQSGQYAKNNEQAREAMRRYKHGGKLIHGMTGLIFIPNPPSPQPEKEQVK